MALSLAVGKLSVNPSPIPPSNGLLLGLAHEALAGSADERHRLGEEHAHRVPQRDCLLVDAALRLHLGECRGGQLDGRVQRQRGELLALGLLHGLGLLLGELAQAAQQILGIASERKTTFHADHFSVCTVFTVEQRDALRDRLVQLAKADPRIAAGALVGSLAEGGDRLSDLDLTFGVADGELVDTVLEEWTRTIVDEFDAVVLFDLPAGPATYRVFFLPGALQFDLSFMPQAEFAATTPKFKLLFGSAGERPLVPPKIEELFGYAVHHALRARFTIERGRYWWAEYWISSLRDYALSLACVRRKLPASYGRGFDDLPAEVRGAFAGSLVSSLDHDELLRAFGVALDGFLTVADGLPDTPKVAPHLLQLKGTL